MEKDSSKKSSRKIVKNDIAISVNHIAKTFKLPTESSNSIKQVFINRVKGIKGFREQKVLKDIDFQINKGDFFGIVGRNGSGKSTLLKIISGIYQPTTGNIQINGSLVSFIELGVGFNPELTGRENVYLNGAMLGFSKDEVSEMYDDIVEFAELNEFMDQKLKNYSSGMQVRLAFSCAIQAKSDILVLDEVLAVGDEAFQRKCNDFFESIKKDKSKTIILVTHDMSSVKQYCNQAMMIRNGGIVAIGSPEDVANEYSLENLQINIPTNKELNRKEESTIRDFHIEMLNKARINQNESVKARITFYSDSDQTVMISCAASDTKRNCTTIDSHFDNFKIKKGKKYSITFEHDLKEVNSGEFRISAQIFNEDSVLIAWIEENNKPMFLYQRTDLSARKIYGDPSTYGVLLDKGEWEVKDKK